MKNILIALLLTILSVKGVIAMENTVVVLETTQ